MKNNVPSITDNTDSRKVGNKNLVQTIQQRINSYISGSDDAKRTITVVYLYGSVLDQEKLKDNSDIDLAFLVEQSLYKQDPFVASSPAYLAATEIGLMLNRQSDVIVLNSASIETAYQAVTTGNVIYEADHDHRLEFEATLRGLYFDFKPFLDKLRRHAILRVYNRESLS